MASTLHVYGKLDDCVQSIESQLKKVPPREHVIIKIRSVGGKMGAMHTLRKLFDKAREEKKCTFSVEATEIRSAALILFLYFNVEERVVTKKTKGSIHLPEGTFEGSTIRESVIDFISKNTLLTPVQVIYLEQKEMSGEELVKRGFAKTFVKSFSQPVM